MDVVIISPEAGRRKEIGQLLLKLADNPAQVQWVTWPKAGYAVPFALLQLLIEAEAEQEAVASEEPAKEPKRRGRPRKEASTDNTTSEEE